MVQIKKVALAGGTGNLGPAIVEQLLSAGFDLTVLTRSEGHPSSIPSSATVKQVDYSSQDSLIAALKGQDAFVSNVGATALSSQPAFVDAAISAGVSFFVPSEFGCDTDNEKAAKLPVFKAKVDTAKYLAEKAAVGKISYARIFTGPFLDWGLKVGFIGNVKDGGVFDLFDGGDVPFSSTNLADIGKAVAGVLKQPDQFKDQKVYVETIQTTQNQLIGAAKKAEGGWSTKIEEKSTEEVEKNSYAVLQNGGDVGGAMVGFIKRAIFGAGYGSKWEKSDNDALGIKQLGPQQLEDLVAKYV